MSVVRLKAVCLALEAFASRLSDSKVFWYSDNQNVESILRNGSRKCDLQELALVFFKICLLHCISLEVKWIPRDLNVSADCISTLVDFDDYGLNDIVFQGLNHLWGPHTIDRFSSSYNAKLPRFNSRFFQPGCWAVDAFAQNFPFVFLSLFRYIPLWFLAWAPEFASWGFHLEADWQSIVNGSLLKGH